MSTSRKIKVVITIVALLVGYWLQQKEEANSSSQPTTETASNKTNNFNYFPTSTTGVIIKHNGYQLSYSEKHEQAEWVAYPLDKNDIVYTNRKRPFFIVDPKVKTKSADWRNYKRSGYDKGHLCPAGDRRASKNAHDETFYTSNISPQNHEFNAGIWNKLEQKTRYWAKKYNHLYVVTGGVLEPNLKTIGKEKVSVPNYFYKVLLDYTQPEIKAIAFLLPHKESNKPLSDFVVSIDELEQKTGIDFFPELPDNIENQLEASANYKNWSFR
ncbi:DNA/RNA non-specific endonuclease [Tenacibaculum singaporense]|uniref:DNA/RNA non-specific endonuclease n=1 Tax=Tenacibaculum singaporense TaxID=2358479 RepID=A0A3S8R589_9FLAO|nr:DNA/RNA non-specific endonuclease [Tenacibaculum singaporense]AZJ34880.1 DNA/RNA non-specific endonuclease [Tenacibaculum singaporense]